jgi:hypothetical protein
MKILLNGIAIDERKALASGKPVRRREAVSVVPD